jgi:hypothetical protein
MIEKEIVINANSKAEKDFCLKIESDKTLGHIYGTTGKTAII